MPAEENWASRSLYVIDALIEPLASAQRRLSDHMLNVTGAAHSSAAPLRSPGAPSASKALTSRKPSAAQVAFSRFSSMFGLGESEEENENEKRKKVKESNKPPEKPLHTEVTSASAPNGEVPVAIAAETLIASPMKEDEVLAGAQSHAPCASASPAQQPAAAGSAIPRRGSRLDFELPFELKRLIPQLESLRPFQMPDLPSLPKLPSMPELPSLPEMPSMPDVSHSISAPLQVLNKIHHNISSSIFVCNPRDCCALLLTLVLSAFFFCS